MTSSSSSTPPPNSPQRQPSSSCPEDYKDVYVVESRLELPKDETIQVCAKYAHGDINFFALVLSSGDLLLVSDHKPPFDGLRKGWTLKHIPWFSDPGRRILALVFDDEGCLFLGTLDGMVLELGSRKILGSSSPSVDADVLEICHLNTIRIMSMLVYNQDGNKIILCSGDAGRFVILTNHSPPVLVTFTHSILATELFVNKAGLTCALVCLSSGQNVYTVLDDLELPTVPESQGKKSIFRKAKDNLMSRFSEERMGFFKKTKDQSGSSDSSLPNTSTSVVSTTTVTAPSVIVGHVGLQKSGSIPLNNVKFQNVEETSFKGPVKKVVRQYQFYRHSNNKLDIFDGDFRQISTTYIPPAITRVFPIHRIYFFVDEEAQSMKVAIIMDSLLKEFASQPLPHKVLAVDPSGEEGTPYTVFITCDKGIYEMRLRQAPLQTCVDLMLSESAGNLLDGICTALNVPKTQVCIKAGDVRSEEGKFSKTIIYYKLAGLSYAQICAKFGSRGQIPAMLFFYELVDQERSKFAGSVRDRQMMSDLAMIGRIEQFLRYGLVRLELPKNPEFMLRKMLINNMHYSSVKASQHLGIPQLLWALKVMGECRRCYPLILTSLCDHDTDIGPYYHLKKVFWHLMTADWLAIYTAQPSVFVWFRALVWKFHNRFTTPMLIRLLRLLLPWRRELQRKIFTEINDLAEIIDFTVSPDTERVVVDDYVTLFLVLLVEAVRQKKRTILRLPQFLFKGDARAYQKQEIANHRNNMVATMMLSYTFVKMFSASQNHCSCVRNGRVYCWGDNKFGRLGIGDSKGRPIVDAPTSISLPMSLKLYVESVAAGQSHTIALTTVGTLLVWGSNKYGQLGLGKATTWTARPVPLDIPNVVFTSISAGSYHTVAIDHLNRVWTWGWGVYGQLGSGSTEDIYVPHLLSVEDKVVFASAGHSHTALLTCYGRVLICGCNHFGQLGLGKKEGKVKVPTLLSTLPQGTLIRLVECGICCTVLVTTKNRIYYCGLNPASLRSIINGAKRKDKVEKIVFEEEKDFSEPMLIDTAHMAGDITKVSAASTHFGVMTSLGYVYTWGIGKSGQLARNDDDTKTLELIDCDSGTLQASDISCAGDCTFVVERETGVLYGCGFNSCGQIGKMESEEDQAVVTVRTKKRLVKIRQPANIYFRLKEISGLPKQISWDGENSIMSVHKVAPPTNVVGQELLEWCLTVFRRNYDAGFMTARCVEAGNLGAASLLQTLVENHEQALRHNLDAAAHDPKNTERAMDGFITAVAEKSPSIEQACRFLSILIKHWSKYSLESKMLEGLLDRYRQNSKWTTYLNQALKEVIISGDESAEWIAANLTPVFILSAIKGSEQEAAVASLGKDKVEGAVSATQPMNGDAKMKAA